MEKEERVRYFEEIYDIVQFIADRLDDTLKLYEQAQPVIMELGRYYASDLWKEDFAADEAGEFPADLKRGVLSEDGVYDLLDRLKQLNEAYAEMFVVTMKVSGSELL